MNNLTLEEIEALRAAFAQPQTSNAAILIFTGIIALSGFLFVMWWILSMKLKPVEKLETQMSELTNTVNEMKGSMWSESSLNNLVQLQLLKYIQSHEQTCPCRLALTSKATTVTTTPAINPNATSSNIQIP